MCKIKRLNSNSFVLRHRYLQILFPPWSPLFQQPILCCVPLLGFMVSAPRFKIQSYCPLFSLCSGHIRFTNHKKINYHTKIITTKRGSIPFTIWAKNTICFAKKLKMKKWNEMKMAKYVHVVPALAFQLVFLPNQGGDCTLEAINEIITKKICGKKNKLNICPTTR